MGVSDPGPSSGTRARGGRIGHVRASMPPKSVAPSSSVAGPAPGSSSHRTFGASRRPGRRERACERSARAAAPRSLGGRTSRRASSGGVGLLWIIVRPQQPVTVARVMVVCKRQFCERPKRCWERSPLRVRTSPEAARPRRRRSSYSAPAPSLRTRRSRSCSARRHRPPRAPSSPGGAPAR